MPRYRLCFVESIERRLLPASIPVLNTNDSGAGSLRAAIAAEASNDTIDLAGLSGTITLAGGGCGADVLCGGSGDDLLRGHGGKDKFFGENGEDRLYGDDGVVPGDDFAHANRRDLVYGVGEPFRRA